MKQTKLLVHADLPHVRKNLVNLPKWKRKNWSHGNGTGKKGGGKKVAHREEWQDVAEILATIDVKWVWEPKGSTYQKVLRHAQSLAILPEGE